MAKYHIDLETYCELDITEVGSSKYVRHHSFEILILAIAKDDGPVHTWDVVVGGGDALAMVREAVEGEHTMVAHNAMFEHEALTFGLADRSPKVEQWICTAAMARRCSIRSSLAHAAEDLKLKHQKDKRGEELIKLFSVPDADGVRTHPIEDMGAFQEFVAYCVQDVEVEREVEEALSQFTLDGVAKEAFHFDMRMNIRGIPFNVPALKIFDRLRVNYDAIKTGEFMEMTKGEEVVLPVTTQRKAPKPMAYPDGIRPSQREACVELFQEYGYPSSSLKSETVDKFMLGKEKMLGRYPLRATLFDLLETRSLIGHAAVKKIPKMIEVACDDGRARGQLLLWGAERTHRWAGRGSQPQNFARPVLSRGESHVAYGMLCDGASIETIEMIFGPFFNVLKSVMRHLIQSGKPMLQADYSAIEARIVQWLTGCNTKALQLFAAGGKVYEAMAGTIFGRTVEDVVAEYEAGNDLMRFVGKQAVLGCGFGAAAPKFLLMCQGYGQDIGEELAEKAVTTWREENPEIASYNRDTPGMWSQLDTASKKLVQEKNFKTRIPVGRLVLGMAHLKKFDAFCVKLPSNHYLVYPDPDVVDVEKPWGPGTELTFYGRVGKGDNWGRASTYGAKLLEHATQAVAGDVMTVGALNAERAGYPAFMLVHDEILTEKEEGQTHERLCELLCDLPEWAAGLPIAAEGKEIPYYLK